jgi:hypothetical protein
MTRSTNGSPDPHDPPEPQDAADGGYIRPHDVVSPRASWGLIAVLHDPGPGDCALALGRWAGDPVLVLRWNGTATSPVGQPQSRGLPIWFVVADRYVPGILATLSPDQVTLIRNFLPRR